MKLKEFSGPAQLAEFLHSPDVVTHVLKDNGAIPNNPKLPLLIYNRALRLPESDAASVIERLLAANHWGGSWRNGIYPYHHYHSTAHEVLIVFYGSARVQLGGEKGITQKLHPGDVVIIPAGVGHKNLGSTHDFAIVGAYPAGQEWDMCYGKRDERPGTVQNIARVPLPKADPVYGAAGPLLEYWRR
jgi:uncharacterized protein YjlB